jgi:hypothetical protein
MCSVGLLVGSGEFWWVLVGSGAVMVRSGGVLVGSGEFWWVLVGSGEFWSSFGVFWCFFVFW